MHTVKRAHTFLINSVINNNKKMVRRFEHGENGKQFVETYDKETFVIQDIRFSPSLFSFFHSFSYFFFEKGGRKCRANTNKTSVWFKRLSLLNDNGAKPFPPFFFLTIFEY